MFSQASPASAVDSCGPGGSSTAWSISSTTPATIRTYVRPPTIPVARTGPPRDHPNGPAPNHGARPAAGRRSSATHRTPGRAPPDATTEVGGQPTRTAGAPRAPRSGSGAAAQPSRPAAWFFGDRRESIRSRRPARPSEPPCWSGSSTSEVRCHSAAKGVGVSPASDGKTRGRPEPVFPAPCAPGGCAALARHVSTAERVAGEPPDRAHEGAAYPPSRRSLPNERVPHRAAGPHRPAIRRAHLQRHRALKDAARPPPSGPRPGRPLTPRVPRAGREGSSWGARSGRAGSPPTPPPAHGTW
jgi:hypothetical protein